MATAHLIVSALIRREGRILLVREQGRHDPEPCWMLPGGRVEAGAPAPDDPDGYILEVDWVEEREALRRLGHVPWYDPAPLRRHLAGDLGGAPVSVVDRR